MAAFIRPDWLGAVAFNSYYEYVSDGRSLHVARAWESIPWQERRYCLHDVHTNALQGSRRDLRVMRQFYINLATERIEQ